MNTKALIIAAVAATFTSGAAFAQSYERDYRNDRYEQNDRAYRGDRYDHNQRAQYGHDRRYDRHDRYDHSRRGHARRDYGYNHGSHYRVRRGEYLAHHYRGSRYVVSDWRGRRLYAPPRGYHWVQAGNDYALVALATGLIAQVLLSN
ncbi:RcnB family protein [Massilia sp. GCM10020059]|uniref:RcnB family protein n=1 Tax=Massilia agrisoli TaxID=2892444 RepID=A0ABS8ISL0_9BURK|nr:RcnB family protein [Massilia agrisoli]MCC6071400.1 RcnB family protein [Massilia agrisoli]